MEKLILRSLRKRHLPLCAAMALLAALVFGLLVGCISFSRLLGNALYAYLEDYRYADGVISVNAAYRSTADEMRQLPGVETVNTRMFLDTAIRSADGRSLAVRTFSRSSGDFTRFYCWEGELTSGGYYLEKNFADRYGISVGDTFSLLLGSAEREIRISAIVSLPEALGVIGNDEWGSMPNLGCLYYSDSILRGSTYSYLCNQFLLEFADDADPEATLESACELLRAQGLTVTEHYVRADSPVQEVITNNLLPVSSMCSLVPCLFFGIVLAVMAMFMSILVRHSRREIGILRGLGFRARDILRRLSVLMAGTTAAGIVVGTPVALAILHICGNSYFAFFPLPPSNYPPDAGVLLLGAVLVMLVPQLTVLGCGAAVSAIQPTEAIRREAPTGAAVPAPVRVLFRRASPILKFNMTTLFRFPRRFWFSALCIAATVMMIFGSVSLRASIDANYSQLFDERIRFDRLVYYRYAPDDAAMERLRSTDGVADAERITYYTSEITFCGRSITDTVAAVPVGSKLVGIPDVAELPERGLVLEKYSADLLGVAVGDTVEVNGTPVAVAGISNQYTSHLNYTSLAQAADFGSPVFAAVMLRADRAATVETALQDMEGYLFFSDVDEMKESAASLFHRFYIIVDILIAFSVSAGLMVVLVTARTSLLERRREICVMRSVGFPVRTISVSWLTQSLVQFLMGCALGLPSGMVLSRWILDRISMPKRTFPYVSGAKELLLSVLLLALYLLIGHAIALRSIRKWNLAEAVKSSE